MVNTKRLEKVGPFCASSGGTLLALEAMKLETHVTAHRDAEVGAVLVAAGDRVPANELLIALRSPVPAGPFRAACWPHGARQACIPTA